MYKQTNNKGLNNKFQNLINSSTCYELYTCGMVDQHVNVKLYTYREDIVKTVILYEHGGQQNVVVVGIDCAFS